MIAQEKTLLRNTIFIPESRQELETLREGKWGVYDSLVEEEVTILGKSIVVRSGLTFTPYANPTKCNAHCSFCSEELLRNNQAELTANRIIGDYEQYFQGLTKVLNDLNPIKNIGLSLSGLEATSDPQWLLKLLELINSGSNRDLFNEKVLYTNSSGLYNNSVLVNALIEAEFDRLEISRCHYDEKVNQRIMFINRNQPVYLNKAYEKLIKEITSKLNIKNSCILTKIGINSIEEVETYLDWAIKLGVEQVVFRELSRLDSTYIENKTKLWVEENRVPIESLLQDIMDVQGNTRTDWTYEFSKAGYYYYNEHYKYKDKVEVILEASSYHELIHRNQSSVVQKLVFHSNGNLCGDWDPNSQVLGNYF